MRETEKEREIAELLAEGEALGDHLTKAGYTEARLAELYLPGIKLLRDALKAELKRYLDED